MANFPNSLDNLIGGQTLLSADLAGIINALEAKFGTGSSTPTLNKLLIGTGTGTSTWTKDAPTGAIVGTTDSQTLTNKTITSPTITSPVITSPDIDLGSDATGDIFYRDSGTHVARLPIGTNAYVLTVSGGLPSWQPSAGGSSFSTLNGPQSFMINGKIVTSVSSNNLTVAIKTLAGTDPAGGDPVYIRIGDTWRTLSAALSVTKNAGTNWMNLGSSENAAKEQDLAVYAGYNATDGITLGFSRIYYANKYGDFSATSTNSRYCAISTITNAASTDQYELIGRFNAILGVSASYNWSIPGTSLIINRPIYRSRRLTWAPTYTGSGTLTYTTVTTYQADYIMDYNVMKVFLAARGTVAGSGVSILASMSIDGLYDGNTQRLGGGCRISDTVVVGSIELNDASTLNFRRYDNANWGTGSGKDVYGALDIPLV